MTGLYGMGAMPTGSPMPAGMPMGASVAGSGGAPSPYGGVVAQGAASVSPERELQNTMGQLNNSQNPQSPLYGRAPGVGNNGFGIHPDVGHHDIVDYLLPKFKSVESQSSGGYTAQHPNYPKYTASGAYGYTDGTWNHYQGYQRAKDAPQEVQDQRMREDLLSQLQRFQGDPFKTVANHYWPALAHDPTKWDQPLTNKYGQPVLGSDGKPVDTIGQYLRGVLPPERVDKYMSGVKASMGVGQ